MMTMRSDERKISHTYCTQRLFFLVEEMTMGCGEKLEGLPQKGGVLKDIGSNKGTLREEREHDFL